MTVREAWEEVSFQVFTDMGGVLRSGFYPTGNGIVEGNVAIDRVWGNFPLQPNDDRTDTVTEIGGGIGDNGYNPTYTYSSDTLRTADYNVVVNNVGTTYKTPADSHTIATTGYQNYPGFIENYAGDGDTVLEVKVPRVVGKTVVDATALLVAAGLVLGTETTTATGATATNDGKVKTQTPAAEAIVNPGSAVNVLVYEYVAP